MIVEFKCPCGHFFRTKSENVGKGIVCPNCLQKSIVPNVGEKVAKPASAAPRSQSAPPPIPGKPRSPDGKLPIRGNRAAPETTSPIDTTPRKAKVRRDDEQPVLRTDRTQKKPVSSKQKADVKTKNNNSSNPFDLSDLDSMEASDDEVEVLEEFDDDFDEEPVVKSKKNKKKKSREDDDDAGATKSKKGKPKRDSSSNLPLILGGVGAAVLVVGMIAFVAFSGVLSSVGKGGKVTLPAEYEEFANSDIYFRCQVPKGWEAESKGGSGNIPPTVKIEKGRVKIMYRSSLSGAAMQDMAQAGANSATGELSDDQKPVYKVHEYQYQKFKAETPDHKESGAPEMIKTGWGEGCMSEFTSTASFGKRVFGYRVTLLTTQYQWNVVCTCPTKKEFEAYKPVFRRIIESTGN